MIIDQKSYLYELPLNSLTKHSLDIAKNLKNEPTRRYNAA